MRILELEIENIRGIHHIQLKPDGKNFLIWGPNGSGKSAVVDAIDFLLTGRISRLTGRGTGDIKLNKHGPHIDHKPDEAKVSAKIYLSKSNKPIEIKRCLSHPNNLLYERRNKQYLDPIINLAGQGQHVLTRRDILRYITSDPSTRAEEIQELLRITEIENIRKTFVRIKRELDINYEAVKNNIERAENTIIATLHLDGYNEKVILKIINQNRLILNGESISLLHSSKIKKGLKHPTISYRTNGDNCIPFSILKDMQNLDNLINERNQKEISQKDKKLRSLIKSMRSDSQSLREFSRLQLTELGIDLIDEKGACPLCNASWPPGKLHEHLTLRIKKAEKIKAQIALIRSISSDIQRHINKTVITIENIIKTSFLSEDKKDILQSWLTDLRNLIIILNTPEEKYPNPTFKSKDVERMLAPDNVQTILKIEQKRPKKVQEIDQKRIAWDTLTRLTENMKALERTRNDLKLAELSFQKASLLLEAFQKARDTILEHLYNNIRDRFVEIYKQLHGKDEKNFTAYIKPKGAGLNLEADFHQRGAHSPNALHSEGHQDSMGLCLYLALSERLNKDLIDLTILDDVMMSIDTTHRREVCRLFKKYFPNRQFLITTHDKTWANQLKSEGVVKSHNIIEFFNWHIDTGPQVNYSVEMWKRIGQDLQKNDISSAAGKLRRGAEEFFSTICETLCVKTVHKINEQGELGKLLPEAMHQYKQLIKKAKSAANSWGDNDTIKMLNELESTTKMIFARTHAEQWAINTNVHYNNWSNFIKEDFEPVVQAFQDLFHVFICSKCSGIIHLSLSGPKAEAVRCNCGKVNWNLIKKKENN